MLVKGWLRSLGNLKESVDGGSEGNSGEAADAEGDEGKDRADIKFEFTIDRITRWCEELYKKAESAGKGGGNKEAYDKARRDLSSLAAKLSAAVRRGCMPLFHQKNEFIFRARARGSERSGPETDDEDEDGGDDGGEGTQTRKRQKKKFKASKRTSGSGDDPDRINISARVEFELRMLYDTVRRVFASFGAAGGWL